MRLRLDTLFGRLFGVLLLAIVLAHLLAFAWFSQYDKPPLGPPPNFPDKASTLGPRGPHPTALRAHGSVGRWYR